MAAVEGGHLDALKWALENGCELPRKTLNVAVEHNRFEIAKWCMRPEQINYSLATL